MGIAAIGRQFDGSFELSFCSDPIPLIPLVFDGENNMCFGIGFVQRDGLQGRFLAFGADFRGSRNQSSWLI